MPRTNKASKSSAERINEAMVVEGIESPSGLARKIGLPRQTVHRWLSDGISNINYRNLLKLADALNVNARWLMYGEVGPVKLPYTNPEEAEALGLARTLSKSNLQQWLSFGRALKEVQRVRKKNKKTTAA